MSVYLRNFFYKNIFQKNIANYIKRLFVKEAGLLNLKKEDERIYLSLAIKV